MRSFLLASILVTIPALAQQPDDVQIVTANLTLEQDAVLRTPLVIKASDIVIDGNGATIQGPGRPGDLKTFVGAGVRAEGCARVTLRNLKVRGFESGLVATDGEGWVIEGCDFSENYHDPDYGWGDYQRVGGLILTRIHKSTIRGNHANRVWNGLDFWECDDNTVADNDFSHCSNVCLKMWTACRNVVTDNNLSYGLRISPGEVHARDSTSVLIESGSNDNRYERNDITHGGDGVFIRVLNGWVSTGNIFIENDCSYANNNGFEAWSPGNTYLRNKANHCSYGFWLGGSDQTVLIGNEAGYNGQPDGFHNAPESDFVHGGIVIVHGTGSHSVIDGNYCHHNNGAGIVFRGDLGTEGAKWKMFHLIVQNNRLVGNRWGIFGRFTDWLDLAGNTFEDNQQDEMFEKVTNLTRRPADPQGKPAPTVKLEAPSKALVGEKVVFDATGSTDAAGRQLEFRWDIGGTIATGPRVEHVFKAPGYYRVGVTAHNGHLAGLAFRDCYAVERVEEIATEGQAQQWDAQMSGGPGRVELANDDVALIGQKSLRMRPAPYAGAEVAAIFPKGHNAGWKLNDKQRLSFWLKFRNENNGGFQGPNPIVRLHAQSGAFTYVPIYGGMPRNLLGDLPYNEARYGWLRITVPLAGSDEWMRSETFAGGAPPHVDHGLKFTTVETNVATQESCSLVSTGEHLYLATVEEERLMRSKDGVKWDELQSPGAALGGPGGEWMNGMLAYRAAAGKAGSLYLRRHDPKRDEFGDDFFRLVAYDVAGNTWSWTPTVTIMSHGTVVVGDYLFGIAHAVGGNYGGPICRVNLAEPTAREQRSVLAPMPGKDAWWFSRAAQFAELGGKIYGIKNDWQTPQPEKADEIGDRLFVFDPAAYQPSEFKGGKVWDEQHWKAANTPMTDLGPLPFEIGHGAALVALPPNWAAGIGAQGGLFIVAGNSPANHEGEGMPSNKYALYDIASARCVPGVLPSITGNGTAAALHNGKLYIKRGGVNYAPSNSELWIVEPVSQEEARAAQERLAKERITLDRVDYLSIQFDSWGNDPFTIWIDGLAFE